MTSGAGASSPAESPLDRRARLFLARDAWKQGRVFFEKAVRRAPADARARAHLGFFCVKESRYDTARGLREFKRAMRLDERCALAHLYRAITLGYMLKLAPAWKALAQAERRGASPEDLAWARGAIELDGGEESKAIGHFRRLTEMRRDSFSMILLSQAFSQAGRNREALSWARRAARADPRDFRAPLYAGIYLAYLRRFAQAGKMLRRASRMARDSPLLWHSLAYVARQEGRNAQEERFLCAALRVDPHYVTSRKDLADLCASSGRVKEARRHYRIALKRFPNYGEAREGLRSLGRRERALPTASGRTK